jgi:hypothetical protein
MAMPKQVLTAPRRWPTLTLVLARILPGQRAAG